MALQTALAEAREVLAELRRAQVNMRQVPLAARGTRMHYHQQLAMGDLSSAISRLEQGIRRAENMRL